MLASAELPPESAELTKKLRDWELEQQVELQQRIRTKRSEVAELLRKQLEVSTKAGDLDGALSIRKEIEKLTGPPTGNPTSSQSDKTHSEQEVQDWLSAQRIKIDFEGEAAKDNNGEIHFLEFDLKAMEGLWDRGKDTQVYRRPIEITPEGHVRFYPGGKGPESRYWDIEPELKRSKGDVECFPGGAGEYEATPKTK